MKLYTACDLDSVKWQQAKRFLFWGTIKNWKGQYSQYIGKIKDPIRKMGHPCFFPPHDFLASVPHPNLTWPVYIEAVLQKWKKSTVLILKDCSLVWICYNVCLITRFYSIATAIHHYLCDSCYTNGYAGSSWTRSCIQSSWKLWAKYCVRGIVITFVLVIIT